MVEQCDTRAVDFGSPQVLYSLAGQRRGKRDHQTWEGNGVKERRSWERLVQTRRDYEGTKN